MNQLDPNKIINGTFGKAWLDGDMMAEVFGVQAKIEITKEEIPIGGSLTPGEKMMGWKGTGSLRMRKVNSRMTIAMADAIKQGILPEFEIMTELADPAAYGAERMLLKQVTFNDLTLVDFETAAKTDIEMPFTFRDYKPIDLINPAG